MNHEDVARIESSLDIELPDDYRRLLVAFPLPAYAGNVDTAFWDDADRLIQYNRELRKGGAGIKPWPVHFYALGRDEGGCAQAIDLRNGELWWMDHCHVEAAGSYRHEEPLKEWAAAYFEDLAADLEGEGGEPSGTPERRGEIEERNARASARFSAALLVILLLVVAAALVWKRLRQ
jgi:hypothetical protein